MLFRSNLSLSTLTELAARLGSDIPFFLTGGAAVMAGRGERITPLDWSPPGYVLLILPAFGISTASVYKALRPEDMHPDERGVWATAPRTVDELDAGCFNDLEAAARRVSPALTELQGQLKNFGIGRVHLSGSGSAMFSLFEDGDRAVWAADRLGNGPGIRTCVVDYIGRRPQALS